MKLYMAVTADEYELPLAVETSVRDLAKFNKIKPQTVSHYLVKEYSGRNTGIRYVKVEVEGGEE